jgi:hypothetical protein
MHRAFLILLPTIAAFSAAGCVVGNASANGQPYSDAHRASYTNFDGIDASAGVEVIVKQGAFDVQATSPNNANLDNLIVEVRDHTLHISRKQKTMAWGDKAHYRVDVSAPAYTGFEASSGASISGANLQLANVDVDVTSGASIELSGACKALRGGASSGARYSGKNLKCETANLEASSGASAQAFAVSAASGQASSGASVNFFGNPARLDRDVSSGGSVSTR